MLLLSASLEHKYSSPSTLIKGYLQCRYPSVTGKFAKPQNSLKVAIAIDNYSDYHNSIAIIPS